MKYFIYDLLEKLIGNYLCGRDLTEQQRKLDDLYYFLSANYFPVECTDKERRIYILASEIIKKKDILTKNFQNIVTFSDLIIDETLLDIDINRDFINNIYLQAFNLVIERVSKNEIITLGKQFYKENLLFQKFIAAKCHPNGVDEKPNKK